MFRIITAPRALVVLGLAAVCALVGASVGSARSADAALDPAAMALAPSDFSAAKVMPQNPEKPDKPAVAGYTRSFGPGTRIGSTPLFALISSVSVYANVADATADYVDLKRVLTSQLTRQQFAKGAAGVIAGKKLKSYAISAPHALAAGQASLFVNLKVVDDHGTMWFRIGWTRLDRAVAQLMMIGWPGKTVGASAFA